jgi:hypothetical protein
VNLHFIYRSKSEAIDCPRKREKEIGNYLIHCDEIRVIRGSLYFTSTSAVVVHTCFNIRYMFMGVSIRRELCLLFLLAKLAGIEAIQSQKLHTR